MSTPLLSAKLIELRQYFNYSQQEVADYLGVTREAYSHYERSTREPGLETLVKLSKLYQVDISELINEKNILYSEIAPMKKMSMASAGTKASAPFAAVPDVITNNVTHLLKLFSGKNSDLDITNVSKEDMNVLAQYKKLSKQDQKEVRQFIKFKLSISKSKRKE